MSRILIAGYVVGMIQTNVWFLHREGETDTIVVDPADHGDQLYEAITGLNAWNETPQPGQARLQIRTILLTHAHFDHIGGVAALRSRSGALVCVNEAEKRLCEDTDANLSASYQRPTTLQPDRWLHDGEIIDTCHIRLRMIATPGHTQGSCCYYIEGKETPVKTTGTSARPGQQDTQDTSRQWITQDAQTQEKQGMQDNGSDGGTGESPILIAGDTLFAESVGRTDMPTGSADEIVRSVREKLFVLPDDTRVFPGHGPCTTIGHEKQYNYFV